MELDYGPISLAIIVDTDLPDIGCSRAAFAYPHSVILNFYEVISISEVHGTVFYMLFLFLWFRWALKKAHFIPWQQLI